MTAVLPGRAVASIDLVNEIYSCQRRSAKFRRHAALNALNILADRNDHPHCSNFREDGDVVDANKNWF